MVWIVAYTAVGAEQLAELSLSVKGARVYFPRRWRRLHRRGGVSVRRPVFSRYIFIEVADGKDIADLGKIESAMGVEHILRSSGHPALISDKVIVDLRIAESIGAFDDIYGEGLRPGTAV